ncbi:MAG: hypothetical protein AAF699_17120 [Pseudomonadota bacterium]
MYADKMRELKGLKAHDAIYRRLLIYANFSWGDSNETPSMAAWMFSLLWFFLFLLLIGVGQWMGFEFKDAHPVFKLSYFGLFACITVGHSWRYGSKEKVVRIFGSYPSKERSTRADKIIDAAIVFYVFFVFVIMILLIV